MNMSMSHRRLPDLLKREQDLPTPPPAEPPTPGPDGLYDRVDFVEAEMCVFNYDIEKGKGVSLHDGLKALRRGSLPLNMPDDVGVAMAGHTIPASVRIDGPRIYATVRFKLLPTHKVEQTFKIRDYSAEQLAEFEATRKAIAAVDTDVVVALFEASQSGATEEAVLAMAAEKGVTGTPAKLLLESIRVLKQGQAEAKKPLASEELKAAAPKIAEAVQFMASQPNAEQFLAQAKASNDEAVASKDPAGVSGSGQVTGRAGVNARITGECVAKLSPDGSVG